MTIDHNLNAKMECPCGKGAAFALGDPTYGGLAVSCSMHLALSCRMWEEQFDRPPLVACIGEQDFVFQGKLHTLKPRTHFPSTVRPSVELFHIVDLT